jgi:capsular exopolysaccharide synthesis family protein
LASWFLLSAKYTAFSQLYLASTPPRVVFNTADSPDGRNEFLTYQRTQAGRIKSRMVLNAALKRDEVKNLSLVTQQADPIAWLEDEIKVEFQEGSEIMTVSMIGDNPTDLVALVDAVTQAYLKEINVVEHDRRSKRFAELTDIYEKTNEKLRLKKDTLRKLAKDLQTSDSQALSQKQLNLLAHVGELRRQHAQVQFELRKAQSRLEGHKAREKSLTDPGTLPETIVTQAMEADAAAKRQMLRLARLKEIVAEYQQTAVRDDEPSLIRARHQLDDAQKALETRRAEILPQLLKRQQQLARSEFEATRAQLESEIGPLADQQRDLHAQLDLLEKEAEKMGNSSTDLELLRDEIKREQKALERVGDEREALSVELRSPPRVNLYQEASLQKKDIKRQLVATILAPIAVLFGVCFCVAWLEFRARRIHTAEEVALGLGVRVVGAVPSLPQTARIPNLKDDTEDLEGHHMLESIDGIRTMLLHEASLDTTRLVMVTSAVGGEGKTTLASHLAGSLARAGRRTLLIDCDLRSPAVHQMFELPALPGFSEALLGEVFVAEATRSTTVEGLWIMPAGEWDREVLQALAKEGLGAIFAKLRAEYDFVVIDSHPILTANDALLIGQHVDGVILSILRDVSQAPRVYAACQRLTTLGIRVLGAVVNGTSQDDVYGGGCTPASQPARA